MSVEQDNIPKGIRYKKAEQRELILQSDLDPLVEGYFDEIRNRSFRPRTEVDVEKVVALETSSKPITPLNNQEFSQLKNYLRDNTRNDIRNVINIYCALAKHQIYLIDEELEKKLQNKNINKSFSVIGPTFLDATTVNKNSKLINTINAMQDLGVSVLQPEKIIELLADANAVDKYRYVYETKGGGSVSEDLLRQGSRNLYCYYKKVEDFKYFREKLERIKKRTNKQMLTIMDVGGNIGRALLDAKNIDPNLKTINMTLACAPAMNGDIILRRPAEYMPAILEENVDLIESKYAFLYFLFPDIALKNIIKALSIGGEANLDFSNDNCPLGKVELLQRMKNIFAWLQKLEQTGYIEVASNDDDPFLVTNALFRKQLQITKKKSTAGL